MTHILLVEDDRSILTTLTAFLEAEGFAVKTASGQTKALELAAQGQFDLVLLDVSLADGNGFAVCKAIKAEYGLPVIFLTASGMNSVPSPALSWGQTTTLPSPSGRGS